MAAVLFLSFASSCFSQTPATAKAWLDGLEARLAGVSGKPGFPVFPQENRNAFGNPENSVYVAYMPLSVLWILDMDSVGDSGQASVSGYGIMKRFLSGSQGRFSIHWDDGGVSSFPWPFPMPEFHVETKYHPLAMFHDRLLSAPLAVPLESKMKTLPAGSRFTVLPSAMAGGIVQRPDSPDRATLWQSFGDSIMITYPDGIRVTHHWQAVDRALASVK